MSSPVRPVTLLLQKPGALADSVISLPCSWHLPQMFTCFSRYDSEISSDATSEKPSLISSGNPPGLGPPVALCYNTPVLFSFLLRTWHNFHNLCVWRFTVYFPFWQMKVLWHQSFCLFIISATLLRVGIHRIWPIDLPNMAQWQIMAFTFANGWKISKEKQYYKTCGNYMKFNLWCP